MVRFQNHATQSLKNSRVDVQLVPVRLLRLLNSNEPEAIK